MLTTPPRHPAFRAFRLLHHVVLLVILVASAWVTLHAMVLVSSADPCTGETFEVLRPALFATYALGLAASSTVLVLRLRAWLRGSA